MEYSVRSTTKNNSSGLGREDEAASDRLTKPQKGKIMQINGLENRTSAVSAVERQESKPPEMSFAEAFTEAVNRLKAEKQKPEDSFWLRRMEMTQKFLEQREEMSLKRHQVQLRAMQARALYGDNKGNIDPVLSAAQILFGDDLLTGGF